MEHSNIGNTSVRDSLEMALLAGIKVWGLEIPEDDARAGVRLFGDDQELVRAAKSLAVPPETLNSLAMYLREHPGFLGSDEARRVLALAGEEWQIHGLVNDVLEALGKIQGMLQQQVDPEALSTVLGTLVFLAMGRFSPEVRRVCQETGYSVDSSEAVGCYADGVVKGESDMVARVDRAVLASELGSVVSAVVRRHARRLFSLAICAKHPALVAVLTDMAREILDYVVGRQSTNEEGKERQR